MSINGISTGADLKSLFGGFSSSSSAGGSTDFSNILGSLDFLDRK